MLILTDCPDDFAWPGLSAGDWARGQTRARPETDADAAPWRALAPDSEIWWSAEVPSPEGAGFWRRLIVVREAPASQFDALRQLCGDGWALPGPVATVALTGRGFHGHRGRVWQTAPGNLHLCAALAPDGMPAREALALVAWPAVAVVEALRCAALGGLRPQIKWVNDILLDGRKVAGVLTASQSQDERVTLALLGIGLNVRVAPAVPADAFVPRVTSLAAQGVTADVAGACAGVLAALARGWADWRARGQAALLAPYREASVVVGRRVAVWDEDAGADAGAHAGGGGPTAPLAEGVVEAIEDDLRLRLRGRAEPVARGRLALLD